MKSKKLTALLLTVAMTASMLAGCGGDNAGGGAETSNAPETEGEGSDETASSGDSGSKDIIDFTMFIAMPGAEINDGNEIQEIIAERPA